MSDKNHMKHLIRECNEIIGNYVTDILIYFSRNVRR